MKESYYFIKKRLIYNDNVFLKDVACLPRVQYEIIGISAKYNIDGVSVKGFCTWSLRFSHSVLRLLSAFCVPNKCNITSWC